MIQTKFIHIQKHRMKCLFRKIIKYYFREGRLALCLLALICCSITTNSIAQKLPKAEIDKFDKKSLAGKQVDGSYVVPTSQIIDPAGTTITFPGRPVDLALNPDETILAVKNLKEIVFF